MIRQERIKLDRKTLKKMGFKRIQFRELFNYYNDYEKAVTIYTCKDKQGYMTQMLFPDELNPNELWKEISKEVLDRNLVILDHRFGFKESGLVYNVLCEDTLSNKTYILVKYDPITKETIITEINEGIEDGREQEGS